MVCATITKRTFLKTDRVLVSVVGLALAAAVLYFTPLIGPRRI